MLNVDEDAVICDLAETYHIYDYRQLPLQTAAALSVNLRDDSRIKLKISGQKADAKTLLLASIADNMALLVWMQTKDGHRNRNRPEGILPRLLAGDDRDSGIAVFDSGAAFETAREALLSKMK